VALAAAAALIVGLLAGTALTYQVASGRTALPGWVPFAQHLTTPTIVPTATGTVYTGPRVAGNLLVSPSACESGRVSVMLQNTAATAISWAAGSPDAPGASFTAGESGTPHPTLADELAPNASLSLLVSGLPAGAHVVVIADGGAVEMSLPTC
jgi:hypothetical protein